MLLVTFVAFGTLNSKNIKQPTEKKIVASPLVITNEKWIHRTDENNDANKQESNIEDTDIQQLTKLIYAEACDLSDEAQIAVASVVLNRVNSIEFPNTIADVIFQEGQYGTVNNGKIINGGDERSYKNALFVYQNGSQIPENVIYQSMFEQGSGIWKIIDGEYFCYE